MRLHDSEVQLQCIVESLPDPILDLMLRCIGMLVLVAVADVQEPHCGVDIGQGDISHSHEMDQRTQEKRKCRDQCIACETVCVARDDLDEVREGVQVL